MGFSKEQADEMQRRVLEARMAIKAIKHAFPDCNGSGRGLLDQAGSSFAIDIDPIGAPRQSRRDAWKPSPRVLRYRAWKDSFVAEANKAGWELGSELRVEFIIAMPDSWSKKKKTAMLGQPHQQRPDIDNLCKAVMDAFGTEDGHVHSLTATKKWGERGMITIH